MARIAHYVSALLRPVLRRGRTIAVKASAGRVYAHVRVRQRVPGMPRLLWRRWDRLMFLAAAVFIAAAVAAVWSSLMNTFPDAAPQTCGGTATLTSGAQSIGVPNLLMLAAGFAAACSGWAVTAAVSINLKVRDRSLDYLELLSSRIENTAELNAHWLAEHIDRLSSDRAALERFFVRRSLDHPFFVSLRALANGYEELAIAIATCAVDEKMMRRSVATSFLWFYPRLAAFLPLFRNDPVPIAGNPRGVLPVPELFSHCEWLAGRWSGRAI